MPPQKINQLLTLPAELRTAIFECVYPQAQQPLKTIDLFQPVPPSKALLLVNKQVYHEAWDLYCTSHRLYWTSNHFTLKARFDNDDDKARVRSSLIALRKIDTDHLTNITIMLAPSSIFTLIHPNGGWKLEVGSGTTYRRYRCWTTRGQLVPTMAAWDGHANEHTLQESCRKCSCRVPLMNQMLHLMGMDLVDYSFGS